MPKSRAMCRGEGKGWIQNSGSGAFFGAPWCRVESGDADPLRQVLEECTRREQRAAVVACLTSQMTSAAHPEDALDVLKPELASDELAIVDHGWLSAQRALAHAGAPSLHLPFGQTVISAV
ncbi:MAG: hypothetical protein ACTHK3_09235 [Solirubrobacterales bacterium]